MCYAEAQKSVSFIRKYFKKTGAGRAAKEKRKCDKKDKTRIFHKGKMRTGGLKNNEKEKDIERKYRN